LEGNATYLLLYDLPGMRSVFSPTERQDNEKYRVVYADVTRNAQPGKSIPLTTLALEKGQYVQVVSPEAMRAFGVSGIPTTIVAESSGVVVESWIGTLRPGEITRLRKHLELGTF